MFPEFTPRTNFMRSAHPGTVTFVGTDGTQRTEPAEHLPDWLKFVPDASGEPVPVVRVVRLGNERNYTIRSYGADGRLLWVGVMVQQPVEPVRVDPEVARRAAARMTTTAQEPTGWF
jgi:hypothetical protein